MPRTSADIPDQRDRIAVITGANSGVGFETARMLAEKGAHVVPACRHPERAAAACDGIRLAVPDAELRSVRLDLADAASVATRRRCSVANSTMMCGFRSAT
ncbi:SDR family NAD(P)-dependent oxidoreductase [Amycolatopsis cynarae]|uniref:SDR family NAD(P)-dependent oxidoreductase n=1 Tax=Amycolatopsis cynarae TaxID=2995223 RepID=A0ABY7B721_9PSEU|nr:SDR family NAD(P)-dependent oxidoreductase [Amycolatopsis sp. HUAS 11-8]WAL67739.1 SDR family NAD(P)-dependent oxidoreductase [Amycolatopsis sp. HUAS 11-8]